VTKKNLEYFIYNYSEKLIKDHGKLWLPFILSFDKIKLKLQIHESGVGGGLYIVINATFNTILVISWRFHESEN
jgi:hypothetical protein